jgi:branched-chain amino acid transport system substrate-binding protein
VVKIGVLSDMSSLYADIGGPGSVQAAKMAVEDYGAAKKGLKVEIVSADHQNKPDVGSGIARKWYDAEGVDVIVDVPTSSVALAINEITKEKGKAFLVSGAATSDLSGKACSPNTVTGRTTPGCSRTARQRDRQDRRRQLVLHNADYAFGTLSSATPKPWC